MVSIPQSEFCAFELHHRGRGACGHPSFNSPIGILCV